MKAPAPVIGEAVLDVDRPAHDDLRLWSVTTIIGALDKPALVYWSATETAKAAVRLAGSLPQRISEEGEEAVAKYLAGARFRRPAGERSAAELGTAVHAACEEYALTGRRPEVDDDVRPFFEQFDAWAQEWQPAYEAAEMTVYNPTYSYAGTTDAILRIAGQRVIVDYKTTAKTKDSSGKETRPYSTVALQLAAYRYAEFAAMWRPRRYEHFRRRYYLLGDEERVTSVPVPEVDGGLCIHITPEHCRAHPVRCDRDVFRSFLYVLECARWAFDLSRSVIGEPLVREG